MSSLFAPITLRGATARNRAGVAPMCRCSAVDGLPDEVTWPAQYERARPVAPR